MHSDHAIRVLSVAVVLGCAVVLALAILRALRHPVYTPLQRLVYSYGFFMARVLWRAEVKGRFKLPPGQGAIIVCNHRGPYDPAFIQLAAGRVVHWMVAKEYSRSPYLAWFFRIVRSIPVSRAGIDTAATKMAIRYVRHGGWVGLFPEGRINTTNALLLPGRPGAALIALRAGVPVVPCYVTGSPCKDGIFASMLTPAKVRLVIGSPIHIPVAENEKPTRQAMEALTIRFLREIAKLAGEPDFHPQLAGRRWVP
jgi:1-acyl-sn-glycerol-3-phosphate acyltransferase